jgi:kynureninase
VLLTGHSHQAWPDVAFEGQVEAWNDAAERVDGKWERALEKADRVRRGFARLLGAEPREVALGVNTHELVTRFISALPQTRRHLVTTAGEFHSIRRQLDRFAEDAANQLTKVPATPSDAIPDRLIAALQDDTGAVLVSSVLFENAHLVPRLGEVLRACRRVGAELLVDAYHHLNVVPFSLAAEGLEDAFVTGGGYKYCQLGEGSCFLRVPPGREHMRPRFTGWFSEFEHLGHGATPAVYYGEGPARWAGSTYDPTSHYRAARVFDFFEAQVLTPERLREISRHQVGLLAARFDALGLDPDVLARDRATPLERVGGFLALRAKFPGVIAGMLAERGITSDFRGETLRLGPAPYLSDAQLETAVAALGEIARHPAVVAR